MNLVKRTITAVVLLGVVFAIIQYAPDWVFFLFGLAFVVAALLEFYNLVGKKDLRPQKVLGTIIAVFVLLTFYFRTIPLDGALCAGILVAGVYYVAAVNSPAKLAYFPASFA